MRETTDTTAPQGLRFIGHRIHSRHVKVHHDKAVLPGATNRFESNSQTVSEVKKTPILVTKLTINLTIDTEYYTIHTLNENIKYKIVNNRNKIENKNKCICRKYLVYVEYSINFNNIY